MYRILAQTTSGPATAPFDWHVWSPLQNSVSQSMVVLGCTLAAGTLIFVLARRQLGRLKLARVYLLGLVVLAVYLSAWGYNPGRMGEASDPVAYWLTRGFAAVMVLVALRGVDRLAVVPLLTRGGTVALPRFFHQMINLVLVLFAILIFGSMAFGWDIDRFLAGSAVVSIVLGLALQETLGNFFSGLVMQASPPFAIGHRIICGAHEGEVVDMTWRAVTLHTDDDNYVVIPNATVAKSDIINFNAPTRSTARFVQVGLEYDLPPADAIAVLKAAALETEGVLKSPEPIVFLLEFADSAVVYSVKFWIDDAGAHEIIQHGVRVHLWYRLRERGYNIPFPIRTVEHSSHAQKSRLTQETARGRRIEAINRVPLFDPLTPEQKRELADSTHEMYLAAGQVLFRQNDAGESFYIIYKGQVEVLVTPEGSKEERVVATLKAGDFFGEMSALTGQPRSATIRAVSPLACVQVEKQDLMAIFQRDPSIMEKISAIVARRNAEREMVLQNAGALPTLELVETQKKTLLGRMIRFFGLGKAA